MVETFVFCRLCQQRFNTENLSPLFLECGHMLCQECCIIRQMNQGITCPFDLKISPSNYRKLRTNMNIVDFLKQEMKKENPLMIQQVYQQQSILKQQSQQLQLEKDKLLNLYYQLEDQKSNISKVLITQQTQIQSLMEKSKSQVQIQMENISQYNKNRQVLQEILQSQSFISIPLKNLTQLLIKAQGIANQTIQIKQLKLVKQVNEKAALELIKKKFDSKHKKLQWDKRSKYIEKQSKSSDQTFSFVQKQQLLTFGD